jgi:hypothetical protein
MHVDLSAVFGEHLSEVAVNNLVAAMCIYTPNCIDGGAHCISGRM